MLIVNERHLSKILTEYTEHYNVHRPHQSRSQRPPATETAVTQPIWPTSAPSGGNRSSTA